MPRSCRKVDHDCMGLHTLQRKSARRQTRSPPPPRAPTRQHVLHVVGGYIRVDFLCVWSRLVGSLARITCSSASELGLWRLSGPPGPRPPYIHKCNCLHPVHGRPRASGSLRCQATKMVAFTSDLLGNLLVSLILSIGQPERKNMCGGRLLL